MPAHPPHGPCLESRFEHSPKSPLPTSYRPLDGVEFKVSSGDTFASLAAFGSINVWDLIRFNYQTSDPREVNWYLHHRTGCKTKDWDDRNYKFDDSDDPGIIFIPTSAYKRMLAAGYEPKRFFSEDSTYRVHGNIRNFSPGMRAETCWAVAGATMIAWKRFELSTLKEALAWAGDKWVKRFEDDIALPDPELLQFGSDAGLNRGGLLDTPDLWIWALKKFGPLMVIQSSAPGYVHWVVVVGYRVTPPSTLELSYVETGNASRRYKDWESMTLSAKRAEGVLPAMFYYR